MIRGLFGNFIFACIARKLCGNHLKNFEPFVHTSIDCEIDIELTSMFGKNLKFKVKECYNHLMRKSYVKQQSYSFL